MPNHYYTSDGKRVTQATIDRKRSESYRKYDDGTTYCRGCGKRADGHGHLIPQARCKQLHLTDLIWDPDNYVKACNDCNRCLENVSSAAFRKLNCYEQCLEIFKLYDLERYAKATL